ncbi:ATP-dependent helicase HrpB [Kocuria sp. JC486]|nr:ATP-dependent helicase HrpB [Kocuria sp. JC486]
MTDLPLPFDLARIGAGLPVTAIAEEFGRVLGNGAVIVQAPPGTGKTTYLPPLVANLLGSAHTDTAGANLPGRVVVTQPRRVAARAAASRLAHLSATAVGDRVGFTVRGQRETGSATVVEFVTPGILLLRALADPDLPGISAVVLDEVHERSLDTDLLLGMLAEVRQLRPELKLVVMSATLDTDRFAASLPDDAGEPAAVVTCPSVLHPLETRWAPYDGPRIDERGVTRGFLDHVADTTVRARRGAGGGLGDSDVLVFLPGAWEVARVAERIRATVDAEAVEVLELHGRIDSRSQDRAVSGRGPNERARIVVSTALAESSLTVPGVRMVVDSGLSRVPRRDTVRGMSGLVTVAASKASADQRAGRAARLGPGQVVRCHDERTWAAMPEQSAPEIATGDLTDAMLTLAVWGTPRGVGLSLPDPLPERAAREAEGALRGLGAVDDDGRATPLGHRLAGVPADPRSARALLDGAHLVGRRTAAEVVAVLASDHRPTGGDLTGLLTHLRRSDAGRTRGAGDARAWRREADRLARLSGRFDDQDASVRPLDAAAAEALATNPDAAVVALARPEWIARRDGDSYLFAGGTRAGLPSDSALRHHDWLAVAEVSRATGRAAAGTGAMIRSAAPLTQEVAVAVGGSLVVDEVRVRFADGKATARRVKAVGAIELSSTPVRPDPEQAQPAIRTALRTQGLDVLPWSDGTAQLRARLAAAHKHLGDPWPAVDDQSLTARLDEWLAPEIAAVARGASVSRIDLQSALRRLLPWPEATRFEELVPERIQVPSGASHRVHWDGDQPVVRVKLQECFGLAESPGVLNGRVPVLFHLLSPAGRELAITADLRSFWEGPYAQVRAEMRGRYPKHPWPEDPWSAPATARTKSRM